MTFDGAENGEKDLCAVCRKNLVPENGVAKPTISLDTKLVDSGMSLRAKLESIFPDDSFAEGLCACVSCHSILEELDLLEHWANVHRNNLKQRRNKENEEEEEQDKEECSAIPPDLLDRMKQKRKKQKKMIIPSLTNSSKKLKTEVTNSKNVLRPMIKQVLFVDLQLKTLLPFNRHSKWNIKIGRRNGFT